MYVLHLSFRATVLPQLIDYRVQRVVLLDPYPITGYVPTGEFVKSVGHMLTLDNPFFRSWLTGLNGGACIDVVKGRVVLLWG